MKLPKPVNTESPITEVSAFAAGIVIFFAFCGGVAQWGSEYFTFAPMPAQSARAETLTQMYLKDNKCWFINTFEGSNGNTRYAYYCEKHPKNPAFADEYVARFDPKNKASELKPETANNIYQNMYKDGVKWGYVTPKPRNESDKKLLAKYTAEQQVIDAKKKLLQDEAQKKKEKEQELQRQNEADTAEKAKHLEGEDRNNSIESNEDDITFSKPIVID